MRGMDVPHGTRALTQWAGALMLYSSTFSSLGGRRMPILRVRVFYHDKCFDGACSASLFTRFHRECIAPEASYDYHGLVHRAGALFDEAQFTGDENAIVDFKYSASPRITWWFDHHQSAFLTPQDHENFLACQRDPKCAARKFFDPTYTSCTSFLAHIASTRYGFDTAPVAELIHWADIVDGAQYESPEAAVEMAAPAMKLTLIIEATQDPAFIPRLIPLLTEMPLAEILNQPFVAPLAAAAARAPRAGDRTHPQPCGRARRDDLLRYHGPPAGRVQQVYPVLPVSQCNLFDRVVEVEFSDEGRGGIESVDESRPGEDGEPGAGLRALWWRRARAGRRNQLSAGQRSGRASGGEGNRCRIAKDGDRGNTRTRERKGRDLGLEDRGNPLGGLKRSTAVGEKVGPRRSS